MLLKFNREKSIPSIEVTKLQTVYEAIHYLYWPTCLFLDDFEHIAAFSVVDSSEEQSV